MASIETSAEAIFKSLLENNAYIKANSIPVNTLESDFELKKAQALIEAVDLTNKNLRPAGGGEFYKLSIFASAIVSRLDKDNRSALDALYSAIFDTMKDITPAMINLSASDFIVDGITRGISNRKPVLPEDDFYFRQTSLELHIRTVTTTT